MPTLCGANAVTADVKGAVTMVAFQPSLTHDRKNSVACHPGVLQKSLSFCLFHEAAPIPLPSSAPPGLRRPSSVSQSPLFPPIRHWPHYGNRYFSSASHLGRRPKREGLSLLCGHTTSHRLLLFEHLDPTRECTFFQITLQTAGEGENKSPQRAQRTRHVHKKGLEGLGGMATLAGRAGPRL